MTPANLNLQIFQGATFGPQTIYLTDDNGAALNITGYAPLAHASRAPGCPSEFDLAPSVSNGTNGEVALSHSNGNTANFPAGRFGWDLLLQSPTGAISGPYYSGRVAVSPLHTIPV